MAESKRALQFRVCRLLKMMETQGVDHEHLIEELLDQISPVYEDTIKYRERLANALTLGVET